MSEEQTGSDMLDKLAREQRAVIEKMAEKYKRMWLERGYVQPPVGDWEDLGRFREKADEPRTSDD